MTIEESVALGAALLDERLPGWSEQVEIEELNMVSGAYCVLGQVFGDYLDGVADLWESAMNDVHRTDLAIEHGFDTEGGNDDYELLRAEWTEQVARRRLAEQHIS